MRKMKFCATIAATIISRLLQVAAAVEERGDSDSTTHRLDVAVTGSGSVTSQPSGINCGSICNASYAANTSVTLTATAASGNSFSAWGGACAGTSAATCTVQMNAVKSVTATFVTNSGTTHTLDVSVTGNGAISSQPAGINCGSTCSAPFASGALVTLTATPANGNQFTAWGGACSGTTATCAVQMNAAASVTATFAPTPPPTGAWSGAVQVRSVRSVER